MAEAQINETLHIPRQPSAPRTFSQPYWDGTREKKIMLQYDKKAGRYQFFPRATSIYSGRRSDIEWREASGKGEVFTYTIARRCREPFRGHEPFFIVLVTLDEGVNVMANTVNVGLDEMKIGLRMKPYWHPLPDGTNLLMFEPDR
ncbi:MAG TPA: Zn-ribbon domain-containing OB-fold protein [Xanthobacteraceae bacterium]|nr:Zn-ribbon domain-containing OB-fold protein [Xanthobacteraceae bacterium]